MAWMVAEAGVAITAGVIASSIALTGFGPDSVIELFSAGIVVWQLRRDAEERETRAVRLVGVTFFLLAAYLVAESIHDLVSLARPEQSVAGLAVTAAALLIMPGLAIAKRRTGQAPGNRSLIADSAESAFCAFTSAAVLIGLGLNAWLGWWWADPAAALVIAVLAVKEGSEGFQSGVPDELAVGIVEVHTFIKAGLDEGAPGVHLGLGPHAEDRRRLDLTDVFVFRSSDDPAKTVLIIDSNPTSAPPPIPPAVTGPEFHPDAVHRINVDTDGDLHADVAFTFTFSEYQNGTQTGTAWYATGPQARQPEAGEVLASSIPVSFDGTARPGPSTRARSGCSPGCAATRSSPTSKAPCTASPGPGTTTSPATTWTPSRWRYPATCSAAR